MEPQKIGKVILHLRKQNNMTQAQLAEKLNVSDKAVSKWELGASVPDIQQMESLTKLFNITYDMLINGDLDKVSFVKPKNNQNNLELVKNKFNPKEWYALDNAAKVYPPQAHSDWNMVFRMAAVLKEDIDLDAMNKALSDMVDRFPTFMVTIKKGVFWYYFERVEKTPKCVPGTFSTCRPMPLDGQNYLFRVMVDGKRVGCEFFHSLTDGTGATIFLSSLLARYYEIKYGPISDFKCALNVLDKVRDEEIEDSFERHAEKGNYGKREVKSAYHVNGRLVKDQIVTHMVMDTTELRTMSKSYNATVTEFLTAVLIRSLIKKRNHDKAKNPIIVQIPINLRKRLESSTLRNFAYFTGIETAASELSLTDAINVVHEQLKTGTDVNNLQQAINANIREERNVAIKVVPLFIKNFALGLVSQILGDQGFTMAFSNVGNLNAPDELKNIVDRFEFVLKEPRAGGHGMGGISFNNKCTITFSRNIKEANIEREFARELAALGLNLYVESNGGNN